MYITALGLLKVFSIALFTIWIMIVIQSGDEMNIMLPLLGFGVALTLGIYSIGWLFIVAGKWVMLQIGLIAANDVIYTLVYFFLLIFCFGGIKRSD